MFSRFRDAKIVTSNKIGGTIIWYIFRERTPQFMDQYIIRPRVIRVEGPSPIILTPLSARMAPIRAFANPTITYGRRFGRISLKMISRSRRPDILAKSMYGNFLMARVCALMVRATHGQLKIARISEKE